MKSKSSNIVCINDIHGCFLTLMALLEQAKKQWGEFDIYFLGDEIDRGPRSREVIEYAMLHKIPTCLGNHEDLCLAYSRHRALGYHGKCQKEYGKDVWLFNGGYAAQKSWETEEGWGTLPRDVLDWMQKLPPYILPDVEPDENGRRLLLSHTGYGLDAEKNNWMRALWGRYPTDGEFVYAKNTGEKMDDGFYRVFGHTPQTVPEITDTYAMIDTGCAYKDRGFGNLTAFHWPSKRILMQSNID